MPDCGFQALLGHCEDRGRQVLIGKAGVPVAQLVRYTGVSTKRVPGALRGQIVIHEGFDELPADIAAVSGIER